ncbi:MAG TPA: hypothetical protein VII06_15930 [Chloroflexota bacterium]
MRLNCTRLGLLVVLLALAGLAAGCVGKADDVPQPVEALAGQPNVVLIGDSARLGDGPSALVARQAADVGDPPVAEDVVAALKRFGRPVGEVDVVSESEARFADTRLAGPDGKPEPRNGGVVEIKATPAEARARPGGLPVLSLLFPPSAEQWLVQGRILLRLSSRLSPDSIDRYATALSRLRG